MDKKQKQFLWLIAGITLLSWTGAMDSLANSQIADTLKDAVVTFGITKLLATTMTFFQGVEINFGIGVSGTLQPFAFLQSLSEVVDDFGDVMRISIISLFIQSLVLKIVGSIYFKLILTAAASWAFFDLYSGKRLFSLSLKFFFMMVFLRYSVILAVSLSVLVNNIILQETVNNKIQNIDTFAESIDINSSGSKLTEEERRNIQLILDNSYHELQGMISNEEALNLQLAEEKSIYNEHEVALQETKKNVGFISSYFGDATAEQEKIIKTLDESKSRIKLLEDQISETYNKQRKLNIFINKNKNEIEDESSSMLSEMKTRASQISASIMRVKNKVQQAYNDFPQLAVDMMFIMTAFLFRTIIMPVMFLYALLRVFRLIWGVDVRDLGRNAGRNIKEELGLAKEPEKLS